MVCMRTATRWGAAVILGSAVAIGIYQLLPLAPAAELPDRIDIGDIQRGQQTRVTFKLRNGGWQPLVVTSWRTSCGCAGVKKHVAGDWVALAPTDEERLGPGEEVELAVQFFAFASLEGPFSYQLVIETNDPCRPSVQVQIHGRIFLGMYTEPRELSLGVIKPGEILRRTVTLVDARPGDEPQPFRLAGQTDAVRTIGEPVRQPDGRHYQVFLEVRAPAYPTSIESGLTVLDHENQTRFTLPVNAVCAAPIYLAPSLLVVPTGAPGAICKRTCICRSSSGPIRVSVVKVPEGVRARVADPIQAQADCTLIHVECDVEKLPPKERRIVFLEAVDERGHKEVLELKIVSFAARP